MGCQRDLRQSRTSERCSLEADRALLLEVFYSVRSERQICEQLRYNLLFRWFVGLGSTMRCGITRCSRRTGTACWSGGRGVLHEIMRLTDAKGLLSKEHFSVDGTTDPDARLYRRSHNTASVLC